MIRWSSRVQILTSSVGGFGGSFKLQQAYRQEGIFSSLSPPSPFSSSSPEKRQNKSMYREVNQKPFLLCMGALRCAHVLGAGRRFLHLSRGAVFSAEGR